MPHPLARHVAAAAALLAVAPLAAPAQAAPADPRAAGAIRAFLAAYDDVKTFQGRVRSETRKDGAFQVTRSQLYLEKPWSTALKILEAPQTRAAEGTKLVWFGEPTVQVQTRFFGFPIKASPRFDDPRLAGLRGWSMRDLSIAAAVAMARDPRSSFKYVGPETFLDRPMTVVEARGPRMLPGTDRQLLWLDDALHLPFVMESFDGAERAFRIEIEKFKFDAKLPADAFRLE